MSVLQDGIGYESLRFYGSFQPQRIEKLQIRRTINDHAYLTVSGILSEEQGASCIGQNMEEEPIVIRQLDEQGQSLRRLFHGIVIRLSVHCIRGVYTFELEAASHSYQMDIQLKKRSYQDIHRTYDDLVTTMVRKYKYGDAIDTVSNNAKLGAFVLQYEETDWAFLKRLASRFGSVLVPEVTAASPKVFFGMPVGRLYKVDRDVSYQVRRTFYELEAGKPEKHAGSYMTYVIESLQYYALGDTVALPIGSGKELVVVRAVTRLEDGLLVTRYDLQSEQDIRYARYENDRAAGITLAGTVLKVHQDLVQLQLDIDPKQDPAKACWFPVATRYVAEEHGGWYVMPEAQERVELYLPTSREHEAYVMDSQRQHRYMAGQPNVKAWRHAQGSGVDMSGQELTLSTSGGFSITLHEESGITVSSPGDVHIQGGHVKLDAGEELSLKAGSALYLKGGASSMVLDGETDIKAPMIDQEGTVKAPVFVMDLPPVPEPPLMNIKDYEAAQTAAAAQTQPSSTPAAKVTSPAALQQANSMLGTVSKLLGSIPVMGKVASAMLSTVGGPAGKVAAMVLQATGAIPARSRGTPTIGSSSRETGGLHTLKHLAGLALQGLISQYEHEQAKDAYYRELLLGKVFTSARHIAHSGGVLELVQNLLKESTAIALVYQKVPKNIQEKWRRDSEKNQRIEAERQTNEYTSFWNQADYFTANWWQDEDKLKQAEQALFAEISLEGKLSLYDIQDPNKMAAIQRIVNAKRTQVWDEKTLNAIEDGLVRMGVDSSNAIELDKEKLDALITRYNRGFIGQKSGDYMERTGLGDLVEETTYGIVGARFGMESVGKPSPKPKQPPVSEKPPVKPNPKDGPGVNKPIDEFDDTAIYNGANSSRSTNSSKPVGGPGKPRPVQQINNRFPDDVQTGKEFSFTIENGYLKNTNGLTEVDFVVDMNGELHIGRGHSFLANGESVQAAGKIKLNGQGQVRSISNLSGHYTPTVEQAKLFPQVLEQAGVKTKNAWLDIYTIETTPSGYVNTNELVKVSSTQIK
ncbi:contractile injection system protein, VgrG/Pvc8 family [Paenibacillus sp. VCA1]|uniref:contractile injection system protein, VgrG/Pvc8 family n=1 Tax=Paenibacillus sp. VCA1 TaxID=3039148 RepID=UPI002870D146|nr:contractile injection system protein, VgrG/Pvc8 family [Paenibacillus sp. VCA1]MDR9855917.1 contractile injection system protein, VgrG/Pvc8 family [Paenibacillus sp. VCA1]